MWKILLFTLVMPELPEVETVVRGLKASILGKKILGISYCAPHLRKLNTRDFAKKLEGRVIDSIERTGKNIFINLDDDSMLWIHLRMTGQLLYNCNFEESDPHRHIVMTFADSNEILVFRDVRKFGHFVYVPAGRKRRFLGQLNLGRDALKMELDEFIKIIKSKNRMIKPLLLDQTIIAGLGNIYVDEILFRSKVHPRKLSGRISKAKLRKMYENMQKILRFAIENMGTTVDTFSDVNSEPGRNQKYLLAYDNAGKFCSICGKRKIIRIVVAQRGTFVCPNCQRL
jgi:formamidopyrimidine-DNA glycosylase